MFAMLLAAGVWSAPSAALAPQLDFESIPAPPFPGPQFPNYRYGFDVYVRTASGKEDVTGIGNAETRLKYCDGMVRLCVNKVWGYHRPDDLKLTLLDVQGDPIVGIRVETYAKDGKGNQLPVVPKLAVRWVPRVVPKVTLLELAPAPSGGAPLARVASGLFVAAVAVVAAPELDCAALPDGKDRPRIYGIYVCSRLASGKRHWMALWGSNDPPACLKNDAAYWFGTCENFNIRTDPLTLRVGVLEHRELDKNGAVTKTDPVVGLYIESNGPPPALRWTWRPGIRDLFRGK